MRSLSPFGFSSGLGAALLLAPVVASAQQAQIRLTNFPTMTVADGRSTVTVTAEIRDTNGRVVPDGTRVSMTSNLGSFREPVVATSGGIARAIFVAGNVPGVVTIKASTLGGEAAPSTLDFELVGDRSQLNSLREYVEIEAVKGGVQYTADDRLMAASGPDGGVTLKFKEVVIVADDVQYDIKMNAVRARRATLKIGRAEPRKFDELWLQLNNRRGYGLATYRAAKTFPVFTGAGFVPMSLDDDGKPVPPVEVERYGSVEVIGSNVRPASIPVGSTMFKWVDLSDSTSSVTAKRATVFPRRGIQFQRAEVFVGAAKVVKVPLFELSFNGVNSTPLLTEQFLNMRDNQLAVNYPYYVSLKPGGTSLFRLRTGDAFGRGVGASSGVFLDFEHNWNRGDQMEGGLAFRGIGRSDWSVGLRQYYRPDERTTLYGSVDSPGGQSLLGSLGLTRQMNGFQLALSGSASSQLRGIRYTAQEWSFVAERDPIKFKKTPFNLYLGFTALENRNSLVGNSQSGYGAYGRLQSESIRLDDRSSLTSTFTVRQLAGGQNAGGGLALLANATLSRQFSPNVNAVVGYDFTRDGYADQFQGQHRLSLTANARAGAFTIMLSGARSLDIVRESLYADVGMKLSNQWRLGSQYTLERFAGTQFLDYNFVIGYRMGWKEIGLTWSYRTKRLGVQVLNVSF